MNLTELQVLALDCQAIGADPAKGHLLEIGWVKSSAAETFHTDALDVMSYRVRLPEDAEIPPAVQRITGLRKTDLREALPASEIWHKLRRAARGIAAADQTDTCPTIIHYARFEKPFLRHLHALENQQAAFPLEIVCTHEIAKRLLPGLPRRGLRAVAGYLGHAVSLQRRSAAHAAATAVIWQNFVRQLAAEHGIFRLDQLAGWLKLTSPHNRIRRVYPIRREYRLSLPEKPGIYRMLRANGDLLYIGKATVLKQRVGSYFRPRAFQAEHTLEMLSQAAKLDVTRTGSALEAAILESDEIKRHCPAYNIALQKRRRQLIFCSADLRKYALKPDKIHCCGPLPDGTFATAMRAFATWHKNSRIDAGDDFLKVGYALLGVPQAYAPEPGCLAEGLAFFRCNHLPRLKHPSPLKILTGLGRDLWYERLKALEKASSKAAEANNEETPVDPALADADAPGWTPEAVARAVEKSIMRVALLIRRSRWLCLLSESSLAWEARNAAGRHKIVLLFEKGAVGLRKELPVEKAIPLPAGYAKCIAERQTIFDVATYDRLRVVTTELRRLLKEGRKIELRLSLNAILKGRQLAKLLPWV